MDAAEKVKRVTRLRFFRHCNWLGCYLSSQDASASDLLDLLFSSAGEEASLDDNGLLGKNALAQNLEVSRPTDVDHWHLLALGCGGPFSVLLGHQRPQLVEVDGRAIVVGLVRVNVKVPHTNFAKVSRMVFVKVDAVVMLATSVTATSRMLAVLANATVTVGDVATQLPGLLFVGTHPETNKILVRIFVFKNRRISTSSRLQEQYLRL